MQARAKVRDATIALLSLKVIEMIEASRDDRDDKRGHMVMMLNDQKQVGGYYHYEWVITHKELWRCSKDMAFLRQSHGQPISIDIFLNIYNKKKSRMDNQEA